MSDLEKIRKFLEEIKDENIKFKAHFYDSINVQERPINEGLVRKYLKKPANLINVEEQHSKLQGEEKYKLWLKMSNKYSLVVIAVASGKDLYIITAWNTDRKWQKAIQK